jgi:hypothetical protein
VLSRRFFSKNHKHSSSVLERSAQVIFVFAPRISCGEDCSEAKFDSAERPSNVNGLRQAVSRFGRRGFCLSIEIRLGRSPLS